MIESLRASDSAPDNDEGLRVKVHAFERDTHQFGWSVSRARAESPAPDLAFGYAETEASARAAAQTAVGQITNAEAKGYPLGRLYIRFDDGMSWTVPAWEEPDAVSVNGGWQPGWLVGSPPERCWFREDFFGCAMGEGEEFEGRIAEEDSDLGIEPFSWKMIRPGEAFDLTSWPLAMPSKEPETPSMPQP